MSKLQELNALLLKHEAKLARVLMRGGEIPAYVYDETTDSDTEDEDSEDTEEDEPSADAKTFSVQNAGTDVSSSNVNIPARETAILKVVTNNRYWLTTATH